MEAKSGFLTVEQLAHRWQKSKWWIYENRARLGIKALPLNNQYRFRLSDVERWEEEHLI